MNDIANATFLVDRDRNRATLVVYVLAILALFAGIGFLAIKEAFGWEWAFLGALAASGLISLLPALFAFRVFGLSNYEQLRVDQNGICTESTKFHVPWSRFRSVSMDGDVGIVSFIAEDIRSADPIKRISVRRFFFREASAAEFVAAVSRIAGS